MTIELKKRLILRPGTNRTPLMVTFTFFPFAVATTFTSPCPATASFDSPIPFTIQHSDPVGTKLTRRSRLPVMC